MATIKYNEKLYQTILNEISDAVIIIDHDFKLKFVCTNSQKKFGLDPKEIIKTGNLSKFIKKELFNLKDLSTQNEINNIEFSFINNKGQAIEVLVDAKKTNLFNGSILLTFRNITEKKKTEMFLKENESKMRFLATTASKLVSPPPGFDIYDYIADIVYRLVSEKGIVIISDFLNENFDWSFRAIRGFNSTIEKASKLVGKDISRLSGKGKSNVIDLYTDVKLIEIGNDIHEISSGIIPKSIVNKLLSLFSIKKIYGIPLMKDGKSFGVVTIIKTSEDQEINNELIEAFVSQASVFINRQKAELALIESEKKLKTIMDYSADAIFLVNKNGDYVYANKTASQMLGYSVDELLQMNIKQIGTQDTNGERFDKIKKDGHLYDYFKLRRKNGSFIYTDLNAVLMPNGLIYGSCRDLTEFYNTQMALKESEEKFRNVLENIQLIGLMLNINAEIIFANDYFLNLTGWQMDEVIGKNWFEYFIPGNISDEIMEVFQKTISEGKFPPTYENEIITKNKTKRLIKWSNTTHYNQNGEPIAITSIGEDITEKRKAELELLKHREKLEETVKERTRELEEKIMEVENMNELFVGREFRIKELKDKIKDLEKKLKINN